MQLSFPIFTKFFKYISLIDTVTWIFLSIVTKTLSIYTILVLAYTSTEKATWRQLLNFLAFDFKKMLIVIFLIGIPLASINMQRNTNAETPWFLAPFSFTASLIQNTYSSFSSGVRGTTALYLNLIDVKTRNRQLEDDNAQLRAKLGKMTELSLENERLNKLLSFKQKTKMELLAAKVIGRDLIQDHNALTINRGSKHGIKKGFAAITVSGVVGYVVKSDILTSQILLLTDRYIAIDSIVQRSRARGVLQGNSKSASLLKYLHRGDDVKEGDLVVTSGLDNIFPKGFPIGTVREIQKSQYGVSQGVMVEPTVNSTNLEELFIVLNAHNENFETTEEEQPGNEVLIEENSSTSEKE